MKHIYAATLAILLALIVSNIKANNIQVSNISLVNNDNVKKTIKIEFDLSWENSWKDDINWDAAWVFVKFLGADSLWHHGHLSTSGWAGTGTVDSVKVPSDKVGAFVFRKTQGSGTFSVSNLQLQWNYGSDGVANPAITEVRLFATEMVYVPEGSFVMNTQNTDLLYFFKNDPNSSSYSIPSLFVLGTKLQFQVVDNRLGLPIMYIENFLPQPLKYAKVDTISIKGNEGIDINNDGIIEKPNYPTGYKAFYMFKYELSEGQYADFLNTLTDTQIYTLGMAGLSINKIKNKYLANVPNRACKRNLIPYGDEEQGDYYYDNSIRLFSGKNEFAYADWSGLRLMTTYEYYKACYGPLPGWTQEHYCGTYKWDGGNFLEKDSCGFIDNFFDVDHKLWGYSGEETGTEINTSEANFNSNYNLTKPVRGGFFAKPGATRKQSGSSYYGIMELVGNVMEPAISLADYDYTTANGDGSLAIDGTANVPTWNIKSLVFLDKFYDFFYNKGFRYVRSDE